MKSISHAPNSTKEQIRLAKREIKNIQITGPAIQELEDKFAKLHNQPESISFSAAREGFLAILKAFGIGQGDEVIIQAYTCIVVPNAIIYSGAKSVYVDIDETLNIDSKLIEQKISSRTKAVVIQHTFGVPANVKAIQDICNKHQILLIEDCAHSMGARYNNQLVGTFGDASFFSLGRDKVISSVGGGLVLVKDEIMRRKVKEIRDTAMPPIIDSVKQSLNHAIKVPLYTKLMGRFKIGQLLLAFAQKRGALSKVYEPCELTSNCPVRPIKRFSHSQAVLALEQLNNLSDFNTHRKKIAEIYKKYCDKNDIKYQQEADQSDSIFLRFTFILDSPKRFYNYAKGRGYLLGNWYDNVVVPKPKAWEQILYTPGSCPLAEEAASKSINFPTYPNFSERDARKLLKIYDDYSKRNR